MFDISDGWTCLLSVILATNICAAGAMLSRRRATWVPWPYVSLQFSGDPTQLRLSIIRDLAALIMTSVGSTPVSRTAIRMCLGVCFPFNLSAKPIGAEFCRKAPMLLMKPFVNVFIHCSAYLDLPKV